MIDEDMRRSLSLGLVPTLSIIIFGSIPSPCKAIEYGVGVEDS